MAVQEEAGVAMFFDVQIDRHRLGRFTSCEGLGCEVVLEPYEEGGNNAFVWQLPTRIKYSTIKLTRPLTSETQEVAKWFASMTRCVSPCPGLIRAMRADGSVVCSWSLREVVPVRWQGPSLSVDNAKAAMETVEIAHHGFESPSTPPVIP
jgi:phage tail-like protein